jgi:hypothetical protein
MGVVGLVGVIGLVVALLEGGVGVGGLWFDGGRSVGVVGRGLFLLALVVQNVHELLQNLLILGIYAHIDFLIIFFECFFFVPG